MREDRARCQLKRARCVTADGARIAYTTRGLAAPNFLLIHGWCCNQTLMSGLAGHLATHGRSVTFDLRGHGRSQVPTSMASDASFLEDLDAVARAAGIQKAILVGHSMGGRIALAATRSLPKLVRGIVLIDTAVVEDPDYVVSRIGQVTKGPWLPAVRKRIERLQSPFSTPRTRNRIANAMVKVPRPIAVRALRGADDIDAAGALAHFSGPVIYVGGSNPIESWETLRAINPRIAYAQVVGAGHFVHLDAPAQLQAAIDRFLTLPPRREPAT